MEGERGAGGEKGGQLINEDEDEEVRLTMVKDHHTRQADQAHQQPSPKQPPNLAKLYHTIKSSSGLIYHLVRLSSGRCGLVRRTNALLTSMAAASQSQSHHADLLPALRRRPRPSRIHRP